MVFFFLFAETQRMVFAWGKPSRATMLSVAKQRVETRVGRNVGFCRKCERWRLMRGAVELREQTEKCIGQYLTHSRKNCLISQKAVNMKKILCYGDSNTFGYNPVDNSRLDEETRWTALLQKFLGNDYEIIEEGGCDRTGFVDNDKGFEFSGQRHFPKTISKKKDIDILILAIGTNDLQFKYNITIHQVENGLEKLITIAQNNARRTILIPPVLLDNTILNGPFSFQFDSTSISKSKKVGKIYKKLAKIYGLDYFDINEYTKPSQTDGLHYDKTGHKIIAEKLSEYIKQL